MQLHKLSSSSSHLPDPSFSVLLILDWKIRNWRLRRKKKRKEVRIKLRGKSEGERQAGLRKAAEIKADPPDGDADSNCLSSIIHQTAVL